MSFTVHWHGSLFKIESSLKEVVQSICQVEANIWSKAILGVSWKHFRFRYSREFNQHRLSTLSHFPDGTITQSLLCCPGNIVGTIGSAIGQC